VCELLALTLRLRRACESSGLGRRDVERHPVVAKLEGRSGELVVVDGLEDVAVGEMLVGGGAIAVFVGRSENDDGEEASACIGANGFEDFEAAELGQFDVEQDHRRKIEWIAIGVLAACEEIVKSFDTVVSTDDRWENFSAAEGHHGEIGVIIVVFDEKDRLLANGHEMAPRVKKKAAPLPGDASAQMRPPWREINR
jgi:hypothetical protein